jgi:hypothetical protein
MIPEVFVLGQPSTGAGARRPALEARIATSGEYEASGLRITRLLPRYDFVCVKNETQERVECSQEPKKKLLTIGFSHQGVCQTHGAIQTHDGASRSAVFGDADAVGPLTKRFSLFSVSEPAAGG